MAKDKRILPNSYRDSVSLMQASAELSAKPGISHASVVMATKANLALLHQAGLLDGGEAFRASDLLIAVEGDADVLTQALDEAEVLLNRNSVPGDDGDAKLAPRSIEMALTAHPSANLALIATPGEYAAAEAEKALRLGLNVMMFSDNVSLDDEIALKNLAAAHGLMLMGPDCGTAIIDGVPLGFANAVRRGSIGIVAASGTGLQQVSCLIDGQGQGISQAIGTGGRDLKEDVGGIMMLQGLEKLADDPATEIIVLVSKPPAKKVSDLLMNAAAKTGKPVVINFLGTDVTPQPHSGVYGAATLEDAAAMAVGLAENGRPENGSGLGTSLDREIDAAAAGFASGHTYVRGLFSGGTFCYEALLILSEGLGAVYSNTPVGPEYKLDDPSKSLKHSAIDMGDDVFTSGRPHPMIDPAMRNRRILEEAGDRHVAVILLDIVLGFGAHDDPAGELAATIQEAQDLAAKGGRKIAFVASICGTDKDHQDLARQTKTLREAGVLLADSNAAAARLALKLAQRNGVDARAALTGADGSGS